MAKKHILVVDDNDDIRKLITTTLGNTFYNLGVAGDGEEALHYLQTHDFPDLVILDMAMPFMSGLDVLRIIKQDPETAHIEVIILSAQTDEASEKEARALGVRAVMAKPFGPLELLRLLDDIFE